MESPKQPPSPPSPSPSPSPSPARPPISLQKSSNEKTSTKSSKLVRRIRSVFRSFPIINPTCKIPLSLHGNRLHHDCHIHGSTRMTGTLFGHRKSRINLAIQENPNCLPLLVLELSIPTEKLLQEMAIGLVRIALECEKQKSSDKSKIIDEPIWTMYCNGRKSGYGVKRDPTEVDLNVMQFLHAVSMGAGVLPSETEAIEGGELMFMRGYFERVVGSRDSESYYMMNPDGNCGSELTIFFIRI